MRTYVDTSFLISLYSLDTNSAAAARVMKSSTGEHLVSTLCELEVANALQLRVFRNEVSPVQARSSAAAFEKDLREGIFQLQPLTEQAFEKARQLSLENTARLGTRTADLLHVAAALDLRADRLYTFDQQQRKLAQALRLKLN